MRAKKSKIASRPKNRKPNRKIVAKKTTRKVAKRLVAEPSGIKAVFATAKRSVAAEPAVTVYEVVETEVFVEPDLGEDEEFTLVGDGQY
jgi:hypothetical protein